MTPWWQRLVARLTLVAFAGSLVLPLMSSTHFQWDDDLDCGSGVLTAGYTRTQFDTGHPPRTSQHCEYCHWLRTIGGAFPLPVDAAGSGRLAVELRRASGETWQAQAFVSDRPSRAPPTTLA